MVDQKLDFMVVIPDYTLNESYDALIRMGLGNDEWIKMKPCYSFISP